MILAGSILSQGANARAILKNISLVNSFRNPYQLLTAGKCLENDDEAMIRRVNLDIRMNLLKYSVFLEIVVCLANLIVSIQSFL